MVGMRLLLYVNSVRLFHQLGTFRQYRIMNFHTIGRSVPIIMLSSQDKIEVAINCMHHRAYDYVVKSETAFVRLQKIISTIFKYKKMEKELNWYMDRM